MPSDKPENHSILFIGDYSRADYVSLLSACKGYMQFTFLHFSSESEEESKVYKSYGGAVYWKDYKNAHELLQSVKPAKAVFLFIDTYYQAALRVACKELSVPTYHLEHGMLADYAIAFGPSLCPTQPRPMMQKVQAKLTKLNQLFPRIKSRLFLNNTITSASPENAAFLKQFISIRKENSAFTTFQKLKSPKRFADTYISFSPKIFEVHRKHDGLPIDQEVHYIGVPYFDQLARVQVTCIAAKAVLFIDQPLAEQGLLQWDMAYKQQFVQALTQICSHQGYVLYVKCHPRQDPTPWEKAQEHALCKLLENNQIAALAPAIPLVLGFYSTYLMPFAAMAHTTLITYENHPAGKLDVSKPFTDAGVAHPVYNMEQLQASFSMTERLHQQQLPNKAKFTKEWLYKFDGKAGERLRAILLRDVPSTPY